MKTSLLKLSEIVTTAGTQVRACLDTSTVDDYATAMQDGAKFPPVVVFHDGSRYILADGFHRVMAATRNGFKDIEVELHKGAKSDALKFALSANAAHGLKRTNADKRRSVVLALQEWPNLSDREIAKISAVGNALVGEVRRDNKQLFDSNSSTRVGADGKERKVPAKKPAPQTEPEPTETLTGGQTQQQTDESKDVRPSVTLKDFEAAGVKPEHFEFNEKEAEAAITQWAKRQIPGRTPQELMVLHSIANRIAMLFRVEARRLAEQQEAA